MGRPCCSVNVVAALTLSSCSDSLPDSQANKAPITRGCAFDGACPLACAKSMPSCHSSALRCDCPTHVGALPRQHVGERDITLDRVAAHTGHAHRTTAQYAGSKKIRRSRGVAFDAERAGTAIAFARRHQKRRRSRTRHDNAKALHQVHCDVDVRPRDQFPLHCDRDFFPSASPGRDDHHVY